MRLSSHAPLPLHNHGGREGWKKLLGSNPPPPPLVSVLSADGRGEGPCPSHTEGCPGPADGLTLVEEARLEGEVRPQVLVLPKSVRGGGGSAPLPN